MIILTSNGLSSPNLFEKTREITANCSTAVIITTASVGYKEKDWHIPRLTSELKNLDLSVDLFDFDVDNPLELIKYDVIEINGGNPFYLLNAINKCNCKDILKDIAETKIIIGVSAGSIVLQKNIDLIAQYSPEMNNEVKISDLTGLGFTDLQILPHYSKFVDKFTNFEERAKHFENSQNCRVIRINDGQGVFIINNSSEIV